VVNALYDVSVVHVRSDPVHHEVRRRSYLWFVDVDDLPDHGLLGRIRPVDHAPAGRSLREDVEEFVAAAGVGPVTGRITMLCGARTFGYVFDPLTVYWCHDAAGELVCVVAEVHNTYGQRHRYLLRPDDSARCEVAKEFYVSPFYPVDGTYRMHVPEPGERLSLTITLHRPGQRPFTASVRGVRRPATRRSLVRALLSYPLETWRLRAAITRHGIALWRKGLPVVPRPPHPSDQPTDHPTGQEITVPTSPAERIAALLHRSAGVALPVRIRAWDGSEAGPATGPVLVVRSRRALRRLLWAPGELGLARAYVTGDLDVEGDIAEGFRQAWRAAGAQTTSGVRIGPAGRVRALGGAVRLGAVGLPPAPPASEARLVGRLHTKLRDRAAISHHYDLSNDFYELLLDETMAYSSAVFAEPTQSLADAQRAKLDLVCRKLDLGPGQHLLDVGCGWGSLILHAAEHYGVRATGVTLSAQQRDFVAKRIADRGLTDKVEVRLQDYRDVQGTFDAVASIEMGEHVGEENYATYARVLHDAVRPGGRLVLQQMSRHAGTAPGGGAFIESYIAPDMHMRPMSETLRYLESAGFEVRHVEALREHYVTTVRHWIDTLEARWDEFVALAGEEVARVWRLYLVGGALAFEDGRMGVDQYTAVRPAR
jgi:cyclopropane fatty-acyl-phospholipid synthase-like methyltransferase/DUF1365 family protein